MSRDRAGVAQEVVRPSGRCGVRGCASDTSVQLICVVAPDGAQRIGAPGEYLNGWALRHGYKHAGWVERCSACFCRESLTRERQASLVAGEMHPVRNWRHEPFSAIQSSAAMCDYFGVARVSDALQLGESMTP